VRARIRAAACAIRIESNTPKHAEPDPDMRASLHPGSIRNAAATSAMTGAIATAAGSRSLPCPSSNASNASRLIDFSAGSDGPSRLSPGPRPSASKTPFVATETDRHVRAGLMGSIEDARLIEPEPVCPGKQPQCCGGVSGAAAETRACWQLFGEVEAAQRQSRSKGRQRAGGLKHQIVSDGPGLGGGGTTDRESKFRARPQRKPVAYASEYDKALDIVVAIRALSTDLKRQIDLRQRLLSKQPWRQNQPPSPGFFGLSASAEVELLSSTRPTLSFCSIFSRSGGSGLRSRACVHWNRASSRRPTFQ
jgi:hypothetical protein